MAHCDPIESSALHRIAKQVGDRLSTFRPESGIVTLHESLQLWLLPPGAMNRAETRDADLAEYAVKSNRWHHQLHDGLNVFGFARSTSERNQNWILREIFETPIAASIDDAITTVDKQVCTGDPLVRLVYAPAFQLYALWLVEEGKNTRVAVAHAPAQFSLPRNEVFNSSVLVRLLRNEEPIVGVSS
jgi:hypothetical protein